MGAGCTISSTNKSFMSMQVVSPQKKNKMKGQDHSQITNKNDQSEMIINNPPLSHKLIEAQDFSPRFDEEIMKKFQIGKFFGANASVHKTIWNTLLQGVNSHEEGLSRLRESYKKSPKLFAANLEKFGTPENYRWECWYLVYGDGYPSSALEEKNLVNRLFYETISSKDCKCEEDIKKDIFRTFPKHPYFAEIDKESQGDHMNCPESMSKEMGNHRLWRLLKAIANQYPHVGYCQGMNFLFAFLLAVSGGKECQVFQLAMKLVEAEKFRLIGFYENGFPLMKLYCFIFNKLLNRRNQKLANHLKSVEFESLWLTKWMLTLLICNFPWEISLRFWDFVIGSESLFNIIKICVALLRHFEKHIIHKDMMEVRDFFNEVMEGKDSLIDKKSPTYINPDLLIKRARKIKLSDKMIGKFTKEYIGTLEKDEEKQNENLLFYKDFGMIPKAKTKEKKSQMDHEKIL